VEAEFHTFLTAALDGGELSAVRGTLSCVSEGCVTTTTTENNRKIEADEMRL